MNSADLVTNHVPWVTLAAAEWLGSVLRPEWRVFEWGAGGSTTYFLAKGCQVTTVEHNPEWADKVSAEVTRNCWEGRWRLLLVDVSGKQVRGYTTLRYPRGNYRDYVHTIRAERPLDFVLIDGRARVACARWAASRIRRRGYLMLDNSDRPDYAPVYTQLQAWPRLEFMGYGPLPGKPWQTTVWQRL